MDTREDRNYPYGHVIAAACFTIHMNSVDMYMCYPLLNSWTL